MPCDYKQYPENWKWLSKQIIADAGNRCELCYAPNGEFIVRDKDDAYPWQLAENIGDGADYPKLTKVVLTVHHINHDKMNSTKQNLIALCQRCHLRLDLAHHMKNRRDKKNNQKNLQLTITPICTNRLHSLLLAAGEERCDHCGIAL
jgi:hypothetical protein